MITKEFIEENKGKRFNIELSDGRKFSNIGFFMYQSIKCYLPSKNTRQGYHIPYDWNVVRITERQKKICTNYGNAKTILNKIHPNLWDELKVEMNNVMNGKESQDFEWHFKNKLKFRNIKKLFPPYVNNNIAEAIKNKTNYNHHAPGKKRDFSVSITMGEDGVLRGFFNSEYSGCLNGDYYLLLNPTTAIFYETD